MVAGSIFLLAEKSRAVGKIKKGRLLAVPCVNRFGIIAAELLERRAGFGRAWGLGEVPAPKELDGLGEPFRPYRSLVAWYCWQAIDER